VDYTGGTTGLVLIPDGSSSVDVVVTPVDDVLVEGDETVGFQITLLAGTSVGDTIDAVDTATGKILEDNDSAPVSIVGGTTAVTEGGATGAVTVTLNLTANGALGAGTLDTTLTTTLPGNADYTASTVTF